VGILKRGIQIASPVAPVTGYMFGKGIYFTDVASKSANYCHAKRDSHEGLLLLCYVALGNCYEVGMAEKFVKLPKYFHSYKAVEKFIPDES